MCYNMAYVMRYNLMIADREQSLAGVVRALLLVREVFRGAEHGWVFWVGLHIVHRRFCAGLPIIGSSVELECWKLLTALFDAERLVAGTVHLHRNRNSE